MLDNKEIERLIQKPLRPALWTPFIRAIREYEMIQDGDRIAVAISGGKDSFLLAKLFQLLYRHGKRNFELVFFVMDPGYQRHHVEQIERLGKTLEIPFRIYQKNLFSHAFKESGKPCYLCARMRRGSLYSIAQELGCNKVALGHHYDDVIETILMNVLSTGITMSMMPKLRSSNFPGMEIIRPLYFVRERDILRFVRRSGLSFLNCACAVAEGDVDSNRAKIKELIQQLKKDFPQVEASIFASANHVHVGAVLGWVQNGEHHSFLENYEKGIDE